MFARFDSNCSSSSKKNTRNLLIDSFVNLRVALCVVNANGGLADCQIRPDSSTESSVMLFELYSVWYCLKKHKPHSQKVFHKVFVSGVEQDRWTSLTESPDDDFLFRENNRENCSQKWLLEVFCWKRKTLKIISEIALTTGSDHSKFEFKLINC